MMNKSENESIQNNTDFGSVLAVARKSKNYTVEQVSEQIKVPVQTITAIETNDIAALPAPTFTQGYIRAYAKFLEISEEKILDIYNVAVPHDHQASILKPRLILPDEASSQSAIMKIVTVLLVLAGLAAVIFGIINYYQEKADVMETALESKEPGFTGNSLDSPGAQKVSISQNARLGNDVLVVSENDESVATDAKSTAETTLDVAETEQPLLTVTETVTDTVTEPVVASAETQTSPGFAEQAVASQRLDSLQPEKQGFVDTDVLNETPLNEAPLDILKIYAKDGSWMSVRDASNKRLLYNTVPVMGSRVLRGRAPFRISLGNARSTSMLINDLVIDMAEYIRGNNTAKFTVSSNEENVVFH